MKNAVYCYMEMIMLYGHLSVPNLQAVCQPIVSAYRNAQTQTNFLKGIRVMKKRSFTKKLSICTAAVMAYSAFSMTLPQTPVLPIRSLSASAASAISTAVSHNFTTQGITSDYFEISGNLSTSKGSMNFQGQNLTQCLKMETETRVSFSTSVGVMLSLAVKDGDTLYIDEVKTAIDTSGITTVALAAGTHTIRKGSGTSNLYYIDIVPSGSTGTTAPVGTQSSVTTTTASAAVSQPSSTTPPVWQQGELAVVCSGGWNEMLFATISGVRDDEITAVSYSGTANGSLNGQDLMYLVRDTAQGARIDIPGLNAGTYTLSVATKKGDITIREIAVSAQDRSGYAHFNAAAGVGAYQDNGSLKENAIVLYVTDENKNSVTLTAKDGTKVTGIGNILNSVGQDSGGGKASNGGAANTNQGIIKKIAKDNTPLVIRIIGDVKAPDGLTAYNSLDYGGTVGDNGYMARIKSGKDITIEGIGSDAVVNGWGFHFMAESSSTDLGKSFEVRNLQFRNVPEDCIGMEGVQSGTTLTAPVERCWIHNNEFYKPTVANPAEDDKDGGDGACDFKRGMYYTNSYNLYDSYHKTNLLGGSDSNLQYHITFHHNYWKNCDSRAPLARQANIHMYNNIFEGQTSYCQNPRADAYIFSEYNLFSGCKNPQQIRQGAIKSFHDTLLNCTGAMDATVVSDRSQYVPSSNLYSDFDTNSTLSYIPSGKYLLHTDTSALMQQFSTDGGTLHDAPLSGTPVLPSVTSSTTASSSTTTTTTTTVTSSSSVTEEMTALVGDANCDGEVDISDVILVSRIAAEDTAVTMTALGRKNADCDGNGLISAADATKILLLIAKIPEAAF